MRAEPETAHKGEVKGVTPQTGLALEISRKKQRETQKETSREIAPTLISPAKQKAGRKVHNYNSAPKSTNGDINPATQDKSQLKVAIIIDDVGINRSNSDAFIDLNIPLTLSFLPYARDVQHLVYRAQEKGHEIMLHFPMASQINLNPGPNALHTKLDAQERLRRIEYNLDLFKDYVGVNNHMGSAYTANRAYMDEFASIVKERDVFLIDSRTTHLTQLSEMAKRYHIPHVSRDVFLDNEEDVAAISQQFKRLQSVAQKRGYAVAIGHPYPETLIALKRWIKVADKLNIKIVSVQELLTDTGQQDHKQDQIVQSKGEEKKVTLAPSTTPTTRLNP